MNTSKLFLKKFGPEKNIMRKLKYFLKRDSLQIVYTKTLLEYVDNLGNNCCQHQIYHFLESCELVNSTNTKLISVTALDTGWETLEKRKNMHRLRTLDNI